MDEMTPNPVSQKFNVAVHIFNIMYNHTTVYNVESDSKDEANAQASYIAVNGFRRSEQYPLRRKVRGGEIQYQTRDIYYPAHRVASVVVEPILPDEQWIDDEQ